MCRHSLRPLRSAGLLLTVLVGTQLLATSPGPVLSAPDGKNLTFENDVTPILEARCVRCHGEAVQKAGLDLRKMAGVLRGGESGTAVAPGRPENSILWQLVSSDKMPPGKEKLTEKEKGLLRLWIDAGARSTASPAELAGTQTEAREVTEADRQFWSFQPPKLPVVPVVNAQRLVRNPIDAFVLAKLEEKGLTLSPEADRLTLLRRVSFDLTGLPPTLDLIHIFLDDQRPDAYERLVDRLLASKHYGERWGRHWLDLAGYADSEGILDADYVRTAAWRYRDYVISAFNEDVPYDRFLQEQIAGDELVDYWTEYRTQRSLSRNVVRALIATGFLRCASDTSRPDFAKIKNAPGYYYQTLDDTIKIVFSSAVGLTIQCAKCHSHKYDPIPQTDYYRVQSIFMSAYRPNQWVPQVQRRLMEASLKEEQEAKEHNSKVDAALGQLKKQGDALRTQFAEKLYTDRLAKLPEQIRKDVRTALATDAARRSEVQKYLAEKFQKELRPDATTLAKLLPTAYPEYQTESQRIEEASRVEAARRISYPEIRATYDLPGQVLAPLLRRGDYLNPGPLMQPGVLSVLNTPVKFEWESTTRDKVERAMEEVGKASDAASVGESQRSSSGRRLAFARWLTQPNHPLTARVLVNRLWIHHFGEGIVSTPDNFGRTGSPPTHPELLDWLATEFTNRGWSIKAMHRLMMTSSTYRQVSKTDPVSKSVDPENHLLWRQRMRRLEAEPLRDAVLAVAGNLNDQMFGPPVPMQRQGDGEIVAPGDATGNRRSIYLQVRRSQPLTMLQVFDQPVIETNCTQRGASIVSSQALTLLNSDFMTRQAELLAARVMNESPNDAAAHAVKLAFGRPARPEELAELNSFLAAQAGRRGGEHARRQALADLCQMLLSANEFAFVD